MKTPSSFSRLMLYSICMLVAAFVLTVEASPPKTMNYQGRLTQPDGTPVNGDVSIVFRLYEAAVGGIVLWSESHTVAVSQGYFDVQLGTKIALTAALFQNPLFLGVTVGTDSEMTPRRPLSSVPSAFRAFRAQFQATGFALYRIAGGCLGANQVTTESACDTLLCQYEGPCGSFSCPPPLYFSCFGDCNQSSPVRCSNALVGVGVVPQK
jgi:hypothetical protein